LAKQRLFSQESNRKQDAKQLVREESILGTPIDDSNILDYIEAKSIDFMPSIPNWKKKKLRSFENANVHINSYIDEFWANNIESVQEISKM